MIDLSLWPALVRRWFWVLAFATLCLYVGARMGVFALATEITTPQGSLWLPNTFASVDHPFHVARADTLWRELASGRILRWVGQHQGGYPVEFYPLGAAWLEVVVRGASLGSLSAQGAHSLAVAGLFLLPGLAYVALARIDRRPVVVGFTALVLHVSLPGSWYHGGYTELVQWGLVTNVAGAVAATLTLPALIHFLRAGSGGAGALAAALAAWAVYCNPRSIAGLAALAAGAWISVITTRSASSAFRAGVRAWPRSLPFTVSYRLILVVALSVMIAAPLLASLLRFGEWYSFVHYSGYVGLADYAAASRDSVTLPVLVLAIAGVVLSFTSHSYIATRATAVALVVYASLTIVSAFSPLVGAVAPQLEPTRLMPLQRFLVLYLAAIAVWTAITWARARLHLPRAAEQVLTLAAALAVLFSQTRPLPGPLLDPASSVVPPVSLFPVTMSAAPQQIDLEIAIRAADDAAAPGTALLVIGSALSWHQQLWAPLWTARPLFYDNWLWYWHPGHVGTPGYRFATGHHYPDAAATLDAAYLRQHGIGGVVVTGPVQEAAERSQLLVRVRVGAYSVYSVRDPATTITFGPSNAALTEVRNQSMDAVAATSGAPIIARANWFPRWQAAADDERVPIRRLDSGYIGVDPPLLAERVAVSYVVQPLDWVARIIGLLGFVGIGVLALWGNGSGPLGFRWYARRQLSVNACRIDRQEPATEPPMTQYTRT